MSQPSAKMLNKLTAALNAVPCSGKVEFTLGSRTDNGFTYAITLRNNPAIIITSGIATTKQVMMMITVTNQIDDIIAKVYNRK